MFTKMPLRIFLIAMLFSNSLFAQSADEFALFNSKNKCSGCALTGKIFSKETLYSSWHVNADVTDTYLINTVWQDINLQGAAFHDTRGDGMRFIHCDMSHINLSYSDLPYLQVEPSNHLEVVNFTGSGLEYSNFSGTFLDRPYFNETVLEEVNFSGAKIWEGKFRDSWIVNADFTDAWVQNADFTDAVLRGTDFTRADLREAKISAKQLATVKSVCNAILPDGSIGAC